MASPSPQYQTFFPVPWAEPGKPSSVNIPVSSGQMPATNAVANGDVLVAPPPVIDRFPYIIGQKLTLAYLSAAYRLCNQGWRWQFVDALNELLEHDPHARGVIRQRLLPIAGARIEILPAELAGDASDSDKTLAKQVADDVAAQFRGIPSRVQAFQRLVWGTVYGLSCSETEWQRSSDPGVNWKVAGLHFVHSRRLNLTDPGSWDVFIYDQGPVSPWDNSPASRTSYGVRIADFPGKFVLHAPSLNGDYATRDGEGRYIAFYLLLKRMIVRATSQDFERTIRPWVVGYFNRELDKDDKTVANKYDIAQLNAAITALGMGALNGVTLPDACRIEVLKDGAKADAQAWATWLDDQVTKAILGQTYTTSPQHHGTHQAAGVAKAGTLDVNAYDALCFGETLQRDLVYWIVALNRSVEIAQRFLPRVNVIIDEGPDPKALGEIGKIATAMDIPVDARKMGERMGLPVIAEDDMDKVARTRMVGTSMVNPIEPNGDDPNDPNAATPVGGTTPTLKAGTPPAKPKVGTTPVGAPDKTGKGLAGEDDAGKKRAMAAVELIRMSDRGDRKVTEEVYEQLLEDYPAKSLDWILAAHWQGPVEVPLDGIDFSGRQTWRASHESIEPYVDRIQGGRMKPVIMVKTPGKPKLVIVDGHHRTLAYEELGRPVIAYVAKVHTDEGPWDALHVEQKKGSSKDPSYLPSIQTA